MRLLYLGSTDIPQPKARAIQIVHTCHALARAGVDVTLLAGRRGHDDVAGALGGYGLEPHPRLRVVRVPIVRIPPNAPPRLLSQFTRVWQASYLAGVVAVLPSELARGRPDIVFARDPRVAGLAGRVCSLLGSRLVYEVHGLPSLEVAEEAGRASLPPAAAARLQRLERAVFSRADTIITITECARRILIDQYDIAAERIRTVPDATMLPTWSAVDQPNRGDRDHRVSVYYAGQLYPWKGAGLVLEAAALVERARFVIIGGLPQTRGIDPDILALERRADELGVKDRVELRGYVPYVDIGDALRAADIALLPLPDGPVARYFTSPLKMFDYMGAGLAIVASDLPSIREVLVHEHNALLAPAGDRSALAAAVRRLVEAPSLRHRLGRQARSDAERYTWDVRARLLLGAFDGTPTDCDSLRVGARG